jgi:hypothetical protein
MSNQNFKSKFTESQRIIAIIVDLIDISQK